ncbi:MAG: response regulator [Lachnospiraceae bacterium]|nr:response regulator [Lachnospiraceae bacterium]
MLQISLSCMMIGSFVFFLLGQFCLPAENQLDDGKFAIYEADWVQVLPDGTRTSIDVPGNCKAEQAEWVTIETTLLPNQDHTWICVRSMQQELNIYVGDELRKAYSTLETQPFGKTSTMTYVLFELYEEDAGKTLRIDFMSDSSYSGYVSEMYQGERMDIVGHFCKSYAPSAIVAVLIWLIGILVSFGGVFVQHYYKREAELAYLGNTIVLLTSWLLVESKIRQFLFPNSTIAMLMGFLLIALLPYPLATYLNCIQERRYEKAYTIIGSCVAINFVAIVILQVMNIKDFFETMTSSHIIIIALILTMAVTITRDIIKGYVKDYREVAIGFAAIMVAGVLEIALSYVVSAKLNGISLCIGLVVLLFTAALKTIRDTFNIEKEKQVALEASASKAQFLANMSHEIRTPINTVIGMNEMILRENQNDEIKEYANNIKSASHLLLGLINDVLDFSKIEAGKLQIVEQDYYLADLLNDIVLSTKIRMEQKPLKLHVHVDENLPAMLRGDDIRIHQIMNNLLSNAVKYTKEGSVSFTAKGEQDENGFTLVLSVEDTGIGIKQEDMDTLFASFARFELDKNRYVEGTGLGLNITERLVTIMNGHIHVDSEYGKGSCFTVRIPQQIVDEKPMGTLDSGRRNKVDEEKAQKEGLYIPDCKILAVDDTKMNLAVVKALLKRTGAQLDTAASGTECLELTKDKKYDLILMDHMMPEPDGIQTLHLICDDEKNPNHDTPVVVLTANVIAGMKEQYMQEGFVDYLSKPIETEKLEAVLKKYLKK